MFPKGFPRWNCDWFSEKPVANPWMPGKPIIFPTWMSKSVLWLVDPTYLKLWCLFRGTRHILSLEIPPGSVMPFSYISSKWIYSIKIKCPPISGLWMRIFLPSCELDKTSRGSGCPLFLRHGPSLSWFGQELYQKNVSKYAMAKNYTKKCIYINIAGWPLQGIVPTT